MRTFIFVYYTRTGEKKEIRKQAKTRQIAEAAYWEAQMRNKQRKRYMAVFELMNRRRVAL